MWRSNGSMRSKHARVPPTMMESVPSMAACRVRATGASAKALALPSNSAYRRRARLTGEVLRSMTVQPSLALATSPPSPRQTCSTSLPPGRDNRMVRQLSAISSIDALLTPSAVSLLSGASSRSAASTARPLLRARLRHIGSPMVPTPMNPILSVISVHDEEPGARFGARAMGEIAVSHLVTLAGFQGDGATVGQLGVQLAFQHQEHVSLLAPMVGQISGRVFHHAHADVVEGARAPIGPTGLTGVFRALHTSPVRRVKGDIEHQHGRAFSIDCACR